MSQLYIVGIFVHKNVSCLSRQGLKKINTSVNIIKIEHPVLTLEKVSMHACSYVCGQDQFTRNQCTLVQDCLPLVTGDPLVENNNAIREGFCWPMFWED